MREPERPPRYNDIRDDYDDEFGADRTPLGIARRRVFIPAVAFIATGCLGIGGSLVGAGAVVYELLAEQAPAIRYAPLLVICGLSVCLFAIVIAGGLNLKELRHRGLALTAAYIVTGLSLAGLYGLPFYPFGIWALVLLYNPNVKPFFDRRNEPPEPELPVEEPPGDAATLESRTGARAYLVAGGIGLLAMLATGSQILWDVSIGGYWTESELLWSLGLTLVGACLSVLLLARRVYLKRNRRQGLSKPVARRAED
ncbi:MAG TPA: hypothetical protein VKE40_14945 [Gemmataceae bacterium]|nr:hypothetical protein [Gemmataceae bacterium]